MCGLVKVAAVFVRACVQAVRLLSERMPNVSHADGAAQGIAIGAWKGKGQQGVLSVEDAQIILSGMQRMLHLRESGNRWGRTLRIAGASRQMAL
jgi:hypothetical protein